MQYINLINKLKALKHFFIVFITTSYKEIQIFQLPRRIYTHMIQLVHSTSDRLRNIKVIGFLQHGLKINSKENKSEHVPEKQFINTSGGISNSIIKDRNNRKKSTGIEPERIRSIDILRGLVILAMIFVNDASGIAGSPGIFLHLKAGQDGMTMADAVFPAFLFIIGLTMPFSLGKRMQKGESFSQIWEHVIRRSVVLLFIGFFMVNLHSIDRSGGMIEYRMWSFLMLTGLILFRIEFPHPYPWMRQALNIVRTSGVLLLIFLAFAYSSKDGTGLMQMRTQWWGIIGLIGWAYLVSAAVYLVFQKLPTGMLGAAALLYCVYLADKSGMYVSLSFIDDIVIIGPFLGTHPAICVSGAAMGKLISENLPEKTHSSRIARALMFGAGFAAAAFMLHSLSGLHSMFKISKLNATPSWGLLSSSIAALAWIAIYMISDIYKEQKFTKILEYAGSNALMAYILSVLAVYGMALLGIHYFQYDFYENWAASMGLWRSIFFSLSVVVFTGILEKFKIRLKL